MAFVFTVNNVNLLPYIMEDGLKWTRFDVEAPDTGRTLDAASAMLTLNNGTFAGDTVSVDLADVEQVATGWSIAAGLTAANATYNVDLATGSATGLALGVTLGDAYGIYEGWGFALEDSTLKFKQLA